MLSQWSTMELRKDDGFFSHSKYEFESRCCFSERFSFICVVSLIYIHRTSLAVQSMGIHLPLQGAWVWPLVSEESTWHGASKLMQHNHWAHRLQLLGPVHLSLRTWGCPPGASAPGASAPEPVHLGPVHLSLCSAAREAPATGSPCTAARRSPRKPVGSNEAPRQPKSKSLPVMQEPQEMWLPSLAQEDPLKENMATDSRIVTWRIPWAEEPGRRLHSTGFQRVRHDWIDLAQN